MNYVIHEDRMLELIELSREHHPRLAEALFEIMEDKHQVSLRLEEARELGRNTTNDLIKIPGWHLYMQIGDAKDLHTQLGWSLQDVEK